MIGIVDGEKLRENRKRRRVRGIVIDVASGGKWKKEVKHDEDEPSVDETIGRREDESIRIDDAAVERRGHRHQSKVFKKRILAGRGRRGESERGRDREHAGGSRIARDGNDIRAKDQGAKRSGNVDERKILKNERGLA